MAKPDSIKPVSRSKHAKVCVFADPGVGKTRLVGTSPGKVLVIAPPTDHRDSMLKADRSRVEEWIVHDWDDMNRALDYLRHEGGEWDWVWVDSMSLLQDHLLDDMFETAVREKPARARFGPDKPEYGVNMYRLASWLRHVVGPDLFNFGFTAHTAQLLPSQDEEETLKLMPWIQGKNMSPKFCGYMNVVTFMEVARIGDKPNRRVLRLSATDRYYAKDQYDMTDNGRVLDPTMTKVIELIEKSRGAPLGSPVAKAARSGKRRRTTKTTLKGR